jgi:kojibiose phosphorylase
LGNIALAERYFRQAAEIDLANNMGNAAGGIHAAAMGGLWQAAVFGFAGLYLIENEPVHQPNLPLGWRSLVMRFHWRGRWHLLTLPEGVGEAGNKRNYP